MGSWDASFFVCPSTREVEGQVIHLKTILAGHQVGKFKGDQPSSTIQEVLSAVQHGKNR